MGISVVNIYLSRYQEELSIVQRDCDTFIYVPSSILDANE